MAALLYELRTQGGTAEESEEETEEEEFEEEEDGEEGEEASRSETAGTANSDGHKWNPEAPVFIPTTIREQNTGKASGSPLVGYTIHHALGNRMYWGRQREEDAEDLGSALRRELNTMLTLADIQAGTQSTLAAFFKPTGTREAEVMDWDAPVLNEDEVIDFDWDNAERNRDKDDKINRVDSDGNYYENSADHADMFNQGLIRGVDTDSDCSTRCGKGFDDDTSRDDYWQRSYTGDEEETCTVYSVQLHCSAGGQGDKLS